MVWKRYPNRITPFKEFLSAECGEINVPWGFLTLQYIIHSTKMPYELIVFLTSEPFLYAFGLLRLSSNCSSTVTRSSLYTFHGGELIIDDLSLNENGWLSYYFDKSEGTKHCHLCSE